MLRFCLAPDVHACTSEEGGILLDLNRDAYIGLTAEQSHALASLVADWPATASASTDIQIDPFEAEAFAVSLMKRGLLAFDQPAAGTPRRTTAIPSEELMPWNQMRWQHIRLHHIPVFLCSLLNALVILNIYGLPHATRRARAHRKARSDSRAPLSSDALRALISSYFHIRTLFFAPRGRCLLDSIVLMGFLKHFGVFPDWVVGVQIKPFSAHSWVQLDAAVLNGTASYVRAYKPILIV
jgi:hypothetical protein